MTRSSRKGNSKHNATGPPAHAKRQGAVRSESSKALDNKCQEDSPGRARRCCVFAKRIRGRVSSRTGSRELQEIIDDLDPNRLHKRRIDVVFTREYIESNDRKNRFNSVLDVSLHSSSTLAEPATWDVRPSRPSCWHPDVIAFALEDLISGGFGEPRAARGTFNDTSGVSTAINPPRASPSR